MAKVEADSPGARQTAISPVRPASLDDGHRTAEARAGDLEVNTTSQKKASRRG
jgi:hypothetical protein